MSFTVLIKSIDDIKRFRIKMSSLKMQLVAFQFTILRELANSLIVDKIHQNMKSAGFSEKIIDGTILQNVDLVGQNKARLFFRSEYFSETGFDVALAREQGTDRHFIKPKNPEDGPKALTGGVNWPHFSKGHMVDGIPALHIVKETIKQEVVHLQSEYTRQLSVWYQKNLENTVAS